MAEFEVTIDGLEDAIRMLDEAPATIGAHGWLKALSAGGNVIADAVDQRTPIKAEDTGGILDKGELKENLLVDIQIDKRLRGGTAEIGFGKVGIVALWVEYGHKLIGHKPDKKYLGEVPPHPFMRPAADASAEPAIDAVVESLKSTVSELYDQKEIA